jgi:hypothetical protein
MEKIYTALNAHELEKHLSDGLVLKGIFGYSKKEIDEGEVPRTLSRVDGKHMERRFHADDGKPYPLFKLTAVLEWKSYDSSDSPDLIGKRVKLKDSVVIEEKDSKYTTLVSLGGLSVSYMDLLEYFVHLDGTPIGKLEDASWKVR